MTTQNVKSLLWNHSFVRVFFTLWYDIFKRINMHFSIIPFPVTDKQIVHTLFDVESHKHTCHTHELFSKSMLMLLLLFLFCCLLFSRIRYVLAYDLEQCTTAFIIFWCYLTLACATLPYSHLYGWKCIWMCMERVRVLVTNGFVFI